MPATKTCLQQHKQSEVAYTGGKQKALHTIKVLEAGHVLNFGDDLDIVTTSGVKLLSDELDILFALHERGGDKVDAVLAAKILQVVDVLVHQDWQVDMNAGKVAILPLPELLAVQHLSSQLCA